jgi:serine protease Do
VITDDTGILSVSVPASWTDVDGSGLRIDDEDAGPGMIASPDIDGFLSGWDTPGVIFGMTDQFPNEEEGWLIEASSYPEDCTLDTASTWEGDLKGPYEVWTNCGGGDTVNILLEVYPPDREYVAILEIQAVTDADTAAVDAILSSFDVAPHR